MRDCFERVQVLHLGTCSEFCRSNLSDGKVDIGTHGTLLKLTVRSTKILNDHTKLLQISNYLVSRTHIRLGYDLDQRHTGTVVINHRAACPVIMHQLTGILLHMDLMDSDSLLAGSRLDLNATVAADWQIQLGNLIVLWIIRIEIILPVKFTILGNTAVCGKTNRNRILYHLLI